MNKKGLLLNTDKSKDSINEIPLGPEMENPDFDLEIDFSDTIVDTIDGVLINGDEEEVRLLFYLIKPDGIDTNDETIKCKGIAEFRIPKSRYKSITKDMLKNLAKLDINQRKIDDFRFNDTNLMMFT